MRFRGAARLCFSPVFMPRNRIRPASPVVVHVRQALPGHWPFIRIQFTRVEWCVALSTYFIITTSARPTGHNSDCVHMAPALPVTSRLPFKSSFVPRARCPAHLASGHCPAGRVQRLSVRSAAATMEGQVLKTYTYDKLSPAELKSVLARPRIELSSILSTVGSQHLSVCAHIHIRRVQALGSHKLDWLARRSCFTLMVSIL